MELNEIPIDINWKRRFLTTTSWFGLAAVLPPLLPLVIPITALFDVVTRRQLSTSRTVIFFTYFFVLESLGLMVAFWLWFRHKVGMSDADFEHKNRELQRWWARGLFWGTARIFSMTIELDGLEALEDKAPAVVLSRHASTLDTMLPIAVVRELKYFRFVIKSELLVDPALDYCAQRIPNVFVNRGSGEPEFEVQKVVALGKELSPNDAVVIYPEGTRFTPKKRARLLEKFVDDSRMLKIATRLKNTLPPLREGVVRLVESTPDADAVFIAHRGIDGAGAMSDLVKGRLTGRHMAISIWRVPAAEVPRTKKEIEEFLIENWRRIDDYIAGAESTEEEPVAVA